MEQLTINDSERVEGELTADEQDSLAVGEKMIAEQEQLLAGKYKNAEELEKAYINLQKKLGDNKPAEEPKAEEPEEVKAEEKPETTGLSEDFLETLWNESQSKYSKDTLEKLEQADPKALAKLYLEQRTKAAKEAPKDSITPQDVKEIKQIAGGEKEYKSMLQWATTNLPKKDVKAFDSIMESGNADSCKFAVESLVSKYKDATGDDGLLITGKAPKATKPGFRSQAELVRAMSDPRYDKDPAYRMDIIEKLERSDLDF